LLFSKIKSTFYVKILPGGNMDKNNFSMKAIIIILLIILLLFAGISYAIFKNLSNKTDSVQSSLKKEIDGLKEEISQLKQLISSGEVRISPAEAEQLISARANEVILAVKEKDFVKLSIFIHPQLGVRFSPYSHVNIGNDLIFSAQQIASAKNDFNIYKWGIYDGSGLPIEFTFDEYYKKFVYDKDFAGAKVIAYNEIIGKGNMINNNFEVYPGSIIVEYHFPGFDPQYEGMDWESLRLVFEKYDNIWYLVGIIHDQWTI